MPSQPAAIGHMAIRRSEDSSITNKKSSYGEIKEVLTTRQNIIALLVD
jgi:hypothetical protein